MSGFKASRVALVAGVGAFGYLAISAFEGAQTSKSTGIPMAQNIDNRHSSAGGSGDSTPAAASQMGSEESREGRQEKAKGFGTKYFDDRHSDQKEGGGKNHK